MHDPMTLAHEIKNPFIVRKSGTFRYRPPLVMIWHADPESDGTDDSCGWFMPKPTKLQRDRLLSRAGEEAREPWFQQTNAESITDPVLATILVDALIADVALALDVKLAPDKATALRNRLLHNGIDNIRRLLAYKSGYHGNTTDDAYWRKEHAMTLFVVIARNILREQRRWWQHPRWHIHHWKITIVPVRDFKRWAFSRCCKCGGRFTWGYAPVGPWHGTGPRWFRSEEGVHHHDCQAPADEMQGIAA